MTLLFPYFSYLLRVFLFAGIISVVVQVHCIYKPHSFFISYFFPEEISTKQQVENKLPIMGDNEVVELQCKSLQQTRMKYVTGERKAWGLINLEDRGYYLFCQMEDGALLLQRPDMDTSDLSARVTVEFGSRGDALSDALFMAGQHQLFLPQEELSQQLVHFLFIERPLKEFVFLAVMYVLFGWLFPIGYVVIQYRSLDLKRFVQLLSEESKGKIQIFVFLVLAVGLNIAAYSNMHDINSFEGQKWRNVKKHADHFKGVLELFEDVSSTDELLHKHQESLSQFLVEEIVEPLKIVRRKVSSNKNESAELQANDTPVKKEVLGLLFIDHAGETRLFHVSNKELEQLYFNSYHASTMCLEPLDLNYGSEVLPLPPFQSISDKRKAVALQQRISSRWNAQNRITDITSEISTVADCETKTIYWLFSRYYYHSFPMEQFINMAENLHKN